jgi:hypothetical protein
VLRLGPALRLRANVDLYNALNGNYVLAVNKTYGAASWRQPTTIMDGRMLQISGTL